jgi:hypothetical protein
MGCRAANAAPRPTEDHERHQHGENNAGDTDGQRDTATPVARAAVASAERVRPRAHTEDRAALLDAQKMNAGRVSCGSFPLAHV